MNCICGFYSTINKSSYQAAIVLSANAHISLTHDYVGDFREITKDIPFTGSVCVWLPCCLSLCDKKGNIHINKNTNLIG